MDIGKFFVQIFGVYPSLTKVDHTEFKLKDHIASLKPWLKEQLQEEDEAVDISMRLTQMGCLGPMVKTFDVRGESANTVNMSKDWLTLQSQTAFSSVRANCCVFKGKWMYEVQLRSKGIMQIGWCSSKCKFTQDTGVGDTRNSYGLDGSKQRLWHVQTRKYGPYWRSGDVFGVCLDMDSGTVEYHRNGIALGEAFSDIERGAGIALFPAVSMAYNDSVTANFGGSPFRHPIEGYEPLQIRPTAMLHNADFLLQSTIALSRQISQNRPQDFVSPRPGAPSASGVQMVIGGLLVSELSKVLCSTYVIEDRAFSYIKSMCVLRSDSSTQKLVYPGSNESTLGTFLTLLWAYMDAKDTKLFISRLVVYLSSIYRETPANLEYEKQRTVIVILTCLCNHPRTRKYLLDTRFFKKNCLPVFLYVKPPDESTLGELLPDEQIWTEGIGGTKEPYMAGCEKLKRATDALYMLQKNLVEVLINNRDDEGASTPTSLKTFASKMRAYVLENCLEHRQSNEFLAHHRSVPTQPAVALSFICIVLDVLNDKYNQHGASKSLYVRPKNFYDGSLHCSFFERLGGVLSHLCKAFRAELIERIGEEGMCALLVGAERRPVVSSDMSIYSAMFVITGGSSSNATLADASQTNPSSSLGLYVEPVLHSHLSNAFDGDRELKDGPANELSAYEDILDSCIMYYYGVAHKYVVMIAELRDNIGTLSDILKETRESFDDVKTALDSMESDATSSAMQDEILKELNEKFGVRKNVFLQRSIELARKQVWYRAVALGDRRRNLLCWMLNGIFDTLSDASADGPLLAFVPETYVNVLPILLDTCLDFSHHDLVREFDHTDIMPILNKCAEFLGTHSADLRIVVASSKDALLQALGTMTCHEMGVRSLEKCSHKSQLSLVEGLLRPYENRAWGQSNWLLNRFWMGDGFAYRDARPPSVWQTGNQMSPMGLLRSRGKIGAHTGLLHHVAPATPSGHYHKLIAEVLGKDEPFSTIFVNSILSQLNWAFSEFILFLQEIQNNVQRQDQHLLTESRQLKICSMCYELTVSLMRSLEMLLTTAPDIFKDPDRANSDLLLNRVCQLICQVLARVTVPPGVFQFVVDLCLPDLSGITHFGIVSAAIGIILALISDEMLQYDWESSDAIIKVPRITRILLSDPSFQVAHLEFTVSDDTTANVSRIPSMPTPKGNFDPQTRVNIDPLTNEVRVVSHRTKKPEQPIMKFNLTDYTSHVTKDEIKIVHRLIEYIHRHESIISDTALPSEENICPICYAKSVSAIFDPCKHQSCANCIAQHLMNNKVCFYCKAQITTVHNFDGDTIYENTESPGPVALPPAHRTQSEDESVD